MDVWAVNYKHRSEKAVRVKVFDTEKSAFDFANHPPTDIKIVGKPWSLMGH